MATAKRTRSRKPKAAAVELVPFTASFVENERAGLRCSCSFPEQCDGSRLIHCTGSAEPFPGEVRCDCAACPAELAEHVTGCEGCAHCDKAECGTCGKRGEHQAEPDATWYCSPECSRKAFTVAS